MTTDRSVVFVSGVRTAIGTFGGSLKNHEPTALAAAVVREAVARANVAPHTVGSVVMGNVIQTNTRDPYLARVAAIDGGLPIETPAITVNRLCGSGFQAIVSAAQQILLGDVDVAVAGGAECMSQAPYLVPAQRWGQKMGDAKMVDTLLGALNDPFGHGHMGITAENVAKKHQVSTEAQHEVVLRRTEQYQAACADDHAFRIVALAQFRDRHLTHGGQGRGGRAGHRGEHRAADDIGVHQPARQPRQPR